MNNSFNKQEQAANVDISQVERKLETLNVKYKALEDRYKELLATFENVQKAEVTSSHKEMTAANYTLNENIEKKVDLNNNLSEEIKTSKSDLEVSEFSVKKRKDKQIYELNRDLTKKDLYLNEQSEQGNETV